MEAREVRTKEDASLRGIDDQAGSEPPVERAETLRPHDVRSSLQRVSSVDSKGSRGESRLNSVESMREKCRRARARASRC